LGTKGSGIFRSKTSGELGFGRALTTLAVCSEEMIFLSKQKLPWLFIVPYHVRLHIVCYSTRKKTGKYFFVIKMRRFKFKVNKNVIDGGKICDVFLPVPWKCCCVLSVSKMPFLCLFFPFPPESGGLLLFLSCSFTFKFFFLRWERESLILVCGSP